MEFALCILVGAEHTTADEQHIHQLYLHRQQLRPISHCFRIVLSCLIQLPNKKHDDLRLHGHMLTIQMLTGQMLTR